jgi:hypothetical protein
LRRRPALPHPSPQRRCGGARPHFPSPPSCSPTLWRQRRSHRMPQKNEIDRAPMPTAAGWRCRWSAGETCENGSLKGVGEGGEGESSVSPKSVHQIAMIPALIKLDIAPFKCKRIVIAARAGGELQSVWDLSNVLNWGEE